MEAWKSDSTSVSVVLKLRGFKNFSGELNCDYPPSTTTTTLASDSTDLYESRTYRCHK